MGTAEGKTTDWLDILDRYRPDVSERLQEYASRPVSEYAASLLSDKSKLFNERRNLGRRHFESAFMRLYSSQLGADGARSALNDLWEWPALHSGPHLHLYTEKHMFSALAFASLMSKAVGQRFTWLLTCSTVKMETKRHNGAGWLDGRSGPLNVFGVPRRWLLRSNICTLRGPIKFRFTDESGLPTDCTIRLRERLGDHEYHRAADAFLQGNQSIWPLLTNDRYVHPILLDDDFLAELLLEHLRDDRSILYRLLFDDGRRQRLHDVIHRLKKEFPEPLVRYPTDIFWLVRGGRTRKLKLQSDHLVEADPAKNGYSIPITPPIIRQLLSERALYPNLFFGYLAAGLLTGSVLLGGARQIFYMIGLRQSLDEILMPKYYDEAILRTTIMSSESDGWATGVVPPSQCDWLQHLDQNYSEPMLDFFCKQHSYKSLKSASRTFECIRTHRVFSDFS